LFTFVIHPGTPLWVILVCGTIVFFTAVIWFSTVAIFLTNRRVQKIFLRFERPINTLLGGLLILLGVKVAWMLTD